MSDPSSEGVATCLSVLMPCFEAATVGEMVARVLASPYVGEPIVIDDGSTDRTADVLAGIDDPRLRKIRQPPTGGRAPPSGWASPRPGSRS